MTEIVSGVETTTPSTEGNATTDAQVFTVGEHSEYIGTKALFEGAVAKEAFIQKLKSENDELRKQLEKLNNLKNFKEEVSAMLDGKVTENVTEAATTANMDEGKVREIAQHLYLEQKMADTVTANLNVVNNALKASYGSDVENKLNNKLSELGMTRAEFEAICGKSPAVALKIADVSPVKFSVSSNIATAPGLSLQPSVGSEDPADSFKKKVAEASGDSRKMREIYDMALKDPSLLSKLGW